jgi:hypothetical protein
MRSVRGCMPRLPNTGLEEPAIQSRLCTKRADITRRTSLPKLVAALLCHDKDQKVARFGGIGDSDNAGMRERSDSRLVILGMYSKFHSHLGEDVVGPYLVF